jgi:hypothetical protein
MALQDKAPIPVTTGIEPGALFSHAGELVDLVDRAKQWAAPRSAGEETETNERDASPASEPVTVISPDEISLERLSLTPGRVVISLTDEQAARIKSINEGNAATE